MAYLEFGKGGPWRTHGARAYNGGLGAEPLVGGSGGEAPLKLKHFLLLNVQWKPQIRPYGNAKKTIKHCCILQFLLKNGKKRTFSYEVACKKIFMVGPKGASHRAPPLNTPLLSSNMYFSGDHCFEHIKFPNFSSRADKNSVVHQKDWEVDPPARPWRHHWKAHFETIRNRDQNADAFAQISVWVRL